jgi:hypothetical protein
VPKHGAFACGMMGAGKDRSRNEGGGGARTDMSDLTPSGEGFDPRPESIEDMLRDVRQALQMDVAFVSKFDEDQLVFRALEGDTESFALRKSCKQRLLESGRCWVRTSDLCRVKAVR